MEILVPIKWSALRTEFDPLSGAGATLAGRFGIDPASSAALEWALSLAAEAGGRVVALTVGSAAAEEGLRTALAAGADRAVRVEAPAGAGGPAVAGAIASQAGGADLIVCGAWSEDGGSASVPPALAALLDRPQACGLLSLEWADGDLTGARRIPGGRRELLRISLPAVVSVEPGTASLRRASMPALLASADAEIAVVAPTPAVAAAAGGVVEPYRPRPRSIPPPPAGADHRERIQSLAGTTETGGRAQEVRLDPPEAAEFIIEKLREWGYLESS